MPIRAHAVGVSALWTPDQEVFAAGWNLLLARHTSAVGDACEPARALRLARHLLAVVAAQEDEERQPAEGPDRVWDPERVARHLERAAAQAYRAYRRTRWLRLLHDGDVVYREPGATRTRRLRVRAGTITADDGGPAPTPAGESPSLLTFDRARYDRLRILTSELKRIARDGGDVTVYARCRPLPARLLRGVFAVI